MMRATLFLILAVLPLLEGERDTSGDAVKALQTANATQMANTTRRHRPAVTSRGAILRMRNHAASNLQQTALATHQQHHRAHHHDNKRRHHDVGDKKSQDENFDVSDSAVQRIMAQIEGRASLPPTEDVKNVSPEHAAHHHHHKRSVKDKDSDASMATKEEKHVHAKVAAHPTKPSEDASTNEDDASTIEDASTKPSEDASPQEQRGLSEHRPLQPPQHTVTKAMLENSEKQLVALANMEKNVQQQTPKEEKEEKPEESLHQMHHQHFKHPRFGSIDTNGDGFIDGIEFQNALARGLIS